MRIRPSIRRRLWRLLHISQALTPKPYLALEQKKRHYQLKYAEFYLGDIVALGDKLKPVDASGTADRLRELRLVQIQEHFQLAMCDEATGPDVLQIYHVPEPFDKHPRVTPKRGSESSQYCQSSSPDLYKAE